MRYLCIFLMSCLWFQDSALADTDTSSQKNANNLKFSGYLDTSYNYLVRSNQFTSFSYDRIFDVEPNGFTLQQAAITLAKQPTEGFGGVANLIVGRDANVIASYGWNPYFGSQTLALVAPQLYLQCATGSLTVIAGELLTLAGAEVIDSTQGPNFSHSLLFTFAEPFLHLGVRGTYAINDKLNLIAGINNGWDNIRDFSRRKTIELGIAYTFNPMFSLSAQGYSGGQRAVDRTATGPESIRDLIDVVLTINATDKLTVVGNYDYGIQPLAGLPRGNVADGIWQGLAASVAYKANDKWYIAGRGEVFNDRNGYRTGVPQTLEELTITLGYAPIKSLVFRAETRHDFSNVNSFLNANKIGTNSNQQSYALEGIYKFST
jgi:hypothetical protein